MAALAVMAYAFVSSTLALTGTTARADLEERLSELTGRPIIVDGPASFTFFPTPVLTLDRVRVGTGEEDGPLMRVDRIIAHLDLTDAILGRTAVARLVLLRPQSYHDDRPARDEDGSSLPREATASQLLSALSTEFLPLLREHSARLAGVRTVNIRDGAARPRDAGFGISNINLVLDWPAAEAPAELSGSFVWQGEQTQLALRAARPGSFLAGQASDVQVQLSAPALQVRYEGTARADGDLALDGALSFSSPSPTRAAAWISGRPSRLPDFGPVSGDARLALLGDTLALHSARIGLGAETGQGSLELTLDGRTALTGSLAFASLNFDRFADAIAPLPRHVLDFQRPIAVGFIEDVDLDLRLSATEGSFAGLPIRQFAATLKTARGQGLLDIGDAELLGGRAQARLSVDLTRGRPQASGRLDLREIDAAGLATLLRLRELGVSGRTSATVDFSAPVTSWETILRGNEVAARISLRDGQMAGLAPEDFTNPGERPLVLATNGAPLSFTALEATVHSRGTYANLEKLSLVTQNGRLVASGFFSLLDSQILMNGQLLSGEETPDDPSFTPSQQIGFRIAGEWPHPTIIVSNVERPM